MKFEALTETNKQIRRDEIQAYLDLGDESNQLMHGVGVKILREFRKRGLYCV
jgi:hypothetical protein